MKIIQVAVFTLITAFSFSSIASGQSQKTPGTITGIVVDNDSRSPLPGATVLVENTENGAATNLEGWYTIELLPPGAYSLRISFIGYETIRKTDVIVRPGRITRIDAAISPSVVTTGEAVVTASPFASADRAVSGLVKFGGEEVRRAPGSAGDVNRALSALPSVGKVNDMRNGLVVRGGSPSENAIYLDGIPVPTINHFPTQGSTDGAISVLNVDLIDDVSFNAGGFQAAYGNRLSSVTEIGLRSGNRRQFDGQLDINLGGAGFIAEGGIGDNRGSWLISARRSWLDFLVNDVLGDEVDAVPTYSDAQGKFEIDLSPNDVVYAIGLVGVDESGIGRESAKDEGENSFGSADFTTSTGGIGWRRLLGASGFATTTLSHAGAKNDIRFSNTLSGEPEFVNSSIENSTVLRNVTNFRLKSGSGFQVGFELEYVSGDYLQFFGETIDPLGTLTPALEVDNRLSGFKSAAFATFDWRPTPLISISPGLRVDRFSSTGNTTVSPRLSLAYHLTSTTTLRGAAGRYYQPIAAVLLAQDEGNKALDDMRSDHVVVGLSQLLSEGTQITIDAYWKGYDRFPVDPVQPGLFTIDEIYYQTQPLGFYTQHPGLVNGGKAETTGIEVLLQKKIVNGIYGQVGGSYSRSRYQWQNDDWRPRVFDNQIVFSAEGGYKLNYQNEFSLRWVYAGGAPYTPFDLDASAEANSGIFDSSRINAERLPNYHSLSLRYDRRFHFSGSTLVAYIDVWNIYGRKNLAGYFWNEVEGEVQEVLQFGTLPIIGIEFEF